MSLAQQLLDTKSHIPPLPSHLVPRERLFQALDRSLEPDIRLTLISAPAGYGKTTLLSSWVHDRRLPAAWVSLDERDNSPRRFFSYLLTALARANPELGALVLPDGPLADDEPAERLLTPLVNQMAACAQPTLLVLDDYHWVQRPPLHDQVAFLIDSLPPQGHIIIATRSDPPLPIAQLRGRGQLNELRMADLQFQDAEASAFLDTFEGLGLTGTQAERLARRTEGWVSGLQMAAASLKGREDKEAFVEAFSGSHRHVMDYLVDEVLRRQPPIIRSFLRATSVVERLSGRLCEALMRAAGEPIESGQAILEQLERDNLFIMPLDSKREWYRYHRLFAELLRARLRADLPDLAPRVCAEASRWFETHLAEDDAVTCAFSTGDIGFAADCVERVAQSTMMRGDTAVFLRWVQRLPEAEVHRRPRLLIFRAWALLFNGAPLSTIEAQLRASADASGPPGSVAALQAYLALSAGEVRRGAGLAEAALRELPEEEVYLRNFAGLCAASARMSSGDEQGSVRMLEQAIQTSQRSGDRAGAVIVLCELAELRLKQLRLDLSQELFMQALDLARGEDGRLLPIGGRALIGLGDIALECYDLERAEGLLEDGIQLSRRWGLLSTFNGYFSLSMLQLAKTDWAGVDQTLTRLHDLARRFDASEWDDAVVDLVEARINLQRGRMAEVQTWVERYQLDRTPRASPPADEAGALTDRLLKYQLPILARWQLALGQIEESMASIEACDRLSRESHRPFLQIECGILEARACRASGRTDEAMLALSEALNMAAPEQIVRPFLSESPEIIALLKTSGSRWPSAEAASYARHLLRIAGGRPASVSGAPPGLIEPLSPRELEVLRLLPTDLSAEEIAEALVVSVNTARTHLKRIYAKLDVHSRHEAVARALELDLIRH